MKTKLFSVLGIVAGLLLTAQPGSAQLNNLTKTTISSAMTASQRFACLASATGVVVPTTQVAGTRLFIDHEAMNVTGVTPQSSSCFFVLRQHNAAHASGATVWLGPPNWFYSVAPQGGQGSPCTLASIYAYPVIVPTNGAGANSDIWSCVASKWQAGLSGPSNYTQFTTISPPNPIAVNATADANGTIWYSQILVPYDATLTGACLLLGATTTNDKVIVALYDSAGNVVANSATAGTTTGTASKYQCMAFTATVSVVGPATYYAAVQFNQSRDLFATYAASSVPTGYGTGNQSGTFGTLAAITPPTSFTANQGPIMMLY